MNPVISAVLLQEIIDFLMKQPWKDINPLMEKIKAALEKAQPPKQEEQSNDAPVK